MIMRVHLHPNVEDGPQLIHVGLASRAAQDASICEAMQFGHVAAQNFVSRRETGVGRNDGVVGAGDGDGGSAVEFVGGETSFPGALGDAVVDVGGVDVECGGLAGGVVGHGESLTVELDGDCGASFRCVDGEALRAVAAVDGGGGGEEGCHGGGVISSLLVVAACRRVGDDPGRIEKGAEARGKRARGRTTIADAAKACTTGNFANF